MAKKKTPIQVELPEPLALWMGQRVERGEFSSMSKLVEHAVRRAQTVQNALELERAALDGVRSGPATPMTRSDWRTLRQSLRARVAARSKSSQRKRSA